MRAGDFPIMSHEIQGMALGMVTYELLLLAHDAVMAIISDKSAGLPTVRQHAQKALTWLVRCYCDRGSAIGTTSRC